MINQEDVVFGTAIALLSGGTTIVAGAAGLVYAKAKGYLQNFFGDSTSEAIENDPTVQAQLQDLLDKRFEEEERKRQAKKPIGETYADSE